MTRESASDEVLKPEPRRHVRLDQTGDDVDGRALRRDHQVDAGRAGELGDAHDRVLDVARGDHHQVGELVDDHQQVRVGGVDALRPGRRHEFAAAHLAVEVVDVPHAGGLHVLVAHVHLAHDPLQRVGRLLRVGDHRA